MYKIWMMALLPFAAVAELQSVELMDQTTDAIKKHCLPLAADKTKYAESYDCFHKYYSQTADDIVAAEKTEIGIHQLKIENINKLIESEKIERSQASTRFADTARELFKKRGRKGNWPATMTDEQILSHPVCKAIQAHITALGQCIDAEDRPLCMHMSRRETMDKAERRFAAPPRQYHEHFNTLCGMEKVRNRERIISRIR